MINSVKIYNSEESNLLKTNSAKSKEFFSQDMILTSQTSPLLKDFQEKSHRSVERWLFDSMNGYWVDPGMSASLAKRVSCGSACAYMPPINSEESCSSVALPRSV